MATNPNEHDAILHVIESWPVEDQVMLARTILRQAVKNEPAETTKSAGRSTWDALYGIAAHAQQPPSDEQVDQWLDEHKTEKYGQ